MLAVSHRLGGALAAAGLLSTLPASALACACGCGVFGVGTSSLFPSGSGGQVWLDFDDMDQNQNRRGIRPAPSSENADKEIETDFLTAGAQYMFNREWGVTVEAPYWYRTFRTTSDEGAPQTFRHGAFGDVRVMGMYTGFSADMSTGVSFGLKLPTGDFKYAGFDRDTAIGTGSTDLLIGAYHLGALNKANTLSYFVQGLWDRPFAYQQGYRPGQEVDAAAGVTYSGLSFAKGKLGVAPLLQLIASHRDRDGGPEANPLGSGYSRVMISPGVELSAGNWKLYGDVELPVYQQFYGDQLASRALFKLILSRSF